MHTVTLNPTEVALQSGGSPVVQTATISGVPADFTVNQILSMAVGAANVDVATSITVDNPPPMVSGVPASTAYALSFATPVQDSATPSTWTVEITYTPV
jgi:hypothetical protein